MFDNFPKSMVVIVSPDGTIKAKTEALVHEKSITVPDVMVQINPGDELRRVLPNGTEEAFEVIDPSFSEGLPPSIPAHFKVKYRKKGVFPQGKGGNYTVHVNGPNARVNIHSQDLSKNFVVGMEGFAGLRRAIEQEVSAELSRNQLLRQVDDLEQAKDDKPSYLAHYQKLMSSAADHMTVLAPFLPFLSKLMG